LSGWQLRTAIREAFKTSWDGKNLSAIKDLNRITKELTIPSRSGSKIVDSSISIIQREKS
jgi:hypothetical protein